jgi:hypothetical protein
VGHYNPATDQHTTGNLDFLPCGTYDFWLLQVKAMGGCEQGSHNLSLLHPIVDTDHIRSSVSS